MAFEDTVIALDLLPIGWQIGFVSQLKQELIDTLGIFVDDFEIIDAKEKYGALRIYWIWKEREYTEHEIKKLSILYDYVADVIYKYEKISMRTCILCGKYGDMKYYAPTLCEECYKRYKWTS